MSRRTEEDDARDMLASLNNKAFRICERIGGEWHPVNDTRAAKVLAALLPLLGDKP